MLGEPVVTAAGGGGGIASGPASVADLPCGSEIGCRRSATEALSPLICGPPCAPAVSRFRGPEALAVLGAGGPIRSDTSGTVGVWLVGLESATAGGGGGHVEATGGAPVGAGRVGLGPLAELPVSPCFVVAAGELAEFVLGADTDVKGSSTPVSFGGGTGFVFGAEVGIALGGGVSLLTSLPSSGVSLVCTTPLELPGRGLGFGVGSALAGCGSPGAVRSACCSTSADLPSAAVASTSVNLQKRTVPTRHRNEQDTTNPAFVSRVIFPAPFLE
jgi:hypothetical protein